MVKTKIIATAGPACFSRNILKSLIKNGTDVIRINFSHATYEFASDIVRQVKEINRQTNRRVKILADLKGNRIRVKIAGKSFVLSKKMKVLIGNLSCKKKSDLIFDYRGSFKNVKKGDRIFIEDGKFELKTEHATDDLIIARSLSNGEIKNAKGVNFPDTRLDFPLLSDEDKEDIRFINRTGFDYVAQSFVRSAKDLIALRKSLDHRRKKPLIIAKVENRESIENIDEILDSCDGIMVARGDLAISVDFYKVPVFQKKLIAKSKKAGKFSIVATQVLESMTLNPMPTRAEVSDAANAVFDGAEFVMLSGETAYGNYPVESVKALDLILKSARRYIESEKRMYG